MDVTTKTIQAGRWTSEVCDCCDDPTSCLETCCCPHCQVSAQYGMLAQGRVGIEPLCCAGMCFIDSFFALGLAVRMVSCRNRSDIRRRFGIEGSDVEDFLMVCCCHACAGSQQYREMSYRGIWPGGLCVSPPISAPQVQPMMGQPYGGQYVAEAPSQMALNLDKSALLIRAFILLVCVIFAILGTTLAQFDSSYDAYKLYFNDLFLFSCDKTKTKSNAAYAFAIMSCIFIGFAFISVILNILFGLSNIGRTLKIASVIFSVISFFFVLISWAIVVSVYYERCYGYSMKDSGVKIGPGLALLVTTWCILTIDLIVACLVSLRDLRTRRFEDPNSSQLATLTPTHPSPIATQNGTQSSPIINPQEGYVLFG